MIVKGYTQLKDSALAEHALLMRSIRNRERLGIPSTQLHWVGWYLLQVARLLQAHIDEILTLENHEFYKLTSIVQDCINRGRKGS